MAGLTAKEMEYEAKIVYESLASGDAPGYTSRQWSILLTQAQEKLIKKIISIGFDKDEKNRRIVAKLLGNYFWTSGPNIPELRSYKWPNSRIVIVPENYYHIVEDVVNDDIRVVPVSYDYVHTNKNNPFDNPNKDYFFWRVIHPSGVILVTDGTKIEKYSMVYLKRPKPIVTKDLTETPIQGVGLQTDCELDPIVHRDIVEYAGKLAKLYANDAQGYQLSALEEYSIK
jgi:hypothetical protein